MLVSGKRTIQKLRIAVMISRSSRSGARQPASSDRA